MKHPLPSRRLPECPNLDQLKRQAKELLKALFAGEDAAVAEVNRYYREVDSATFALHHAQLVLARSYGFESWPKLKAYVEGVTIGRLIERVRAGDVEGVRAILRIRPELVNREAPSSHGHMALHYAVLGRMPGLVRALMQSGADPHAGTAGIYALRDAASPLAIAVERGYHEIAAIIREEEERREAGRPTAENTVAELRRTLETGDEDRAIDLLTGHPELIHWRLAGSRWTLLHQASALLLPRIAGWLLDSGADVNGRASDGSSPLEVAGLHRNPAGRAEAIVEMARFLHGRGAELTARSAVILGDEASLRRRAAEEDLVTPRDDRGWLLRLAVDCDRPENLEAVARSRARSGCASARGR